MAGRHRFALLTAATLAALVACAIGAAHMDGIDTGLLYLAPALLLLWPLLGGRYVGEDAVGRLAAAHRATTRRPRGAAVPVAARRRTVLLPRGGRLLASAFATRPPPLGV